MVFIRINNSKYCYTFSLNDRDDTIIVSTMKAFVSKVGYIPSRMIWECDLKLIGGFFADCFDYHDDNEDTSPTI